jgi:hypothetical protein
MFNIFEPIFHNNISNNIMSGGAINNKTINNTKKIVKYQLKKYY